MNIVKKVSYLKGLAEGLEISSDSKNGKIIKGILDILEDMADSIDFLENETETLEDYIAGIDEDLGMLEEDYMKKRGNKSLLPNFNVGGGDSDGLDCDCFDYDLHDGGDEEDEEKESAENELLDGVVELKCPFCKEFILVETDEILESEDMSVECPECGEEIELTNHENGVHSCGGCAARLNNENNGDNGSGEDNGGESLAF
ncbi:MAG: hypothetical protein FWH10_09070 [Oscillospiraceae bacterium]|nr:hypothetical protein [Oscillospiraceae bacterium]